MSSLRFARTACRHRPATPSLVLVDCGVIIRRDSPNGKRYARKDRDGLINQAFGFDLAPLVARAAEFEAMAEEIRAADRALARPRTHHAAPS